MSPGNAKHILIVGASSDMAREVARRYAEGGGALFLVGRNAEKLQRLAQDLQVRGATKVATALVDMADPSMAAANTAQRVVAEAVTSLGQIDIALIAHGLLPDQRGCEQDARAFAEAWAVNFTSAAHFAMALMTYFEGRRQGVLAVISSVAGERGRFSNYVYGAAKAALSTLLQGLRARGYRAGVHVLTIKPGFVDTQMTQNHKKNFLYASAEGVAAQICRGIAARADVVYTPSFWRWIMLVIRCLPERLAKRLSF